MQILPVVYAMQIITVLMAIYVRYVLPIHSQWLGMLISLVAHEEQTITEQMGCVRYVLPTAGLCLELRGSLIAFVIQATLVKMGAYAAYQCVPRENIPVLQTIPCAMQTQQLLLEVINNACKTAIATIPPVTESVPITVVMGMAFWEVRGGIISVGQAVTFGKPVVHNVFAELLLLVLTDAMNAH